MTPHYSTSTTQGDYTVSATNTSASITITDNSTNSGYNHFQTEWNPRYLILDPDVRAYINKGFLLDFITQLYNKHNKRNEKRIHPVAVNEKYALAPTRSMLQRWNE